MKTFDLSELKKEIISVYGSVSKMKQHLIDTSKYEYGCMYSEISIYGCKVSYNTNSNCWAMFQISIPTVGMSNSLALDRESINRVGFERGCGSEFINL